MTLVTVTLHGLIIYLATTYVPLFSQSVKLQTPLASAISMLPSCCGVIGFALLSGVAVGYHTAVYVAVLGVIGVHRGRYGFVLAHEYGIFGRGDGGLPVGGRRGPRRTLYRVAAGRASGCRSGGTRAWRRIVWRRAVCLGPWWDWRWARQSLRVYSKSRSPLGESSIRCPRSSKD